MTQANDDKVRLGMVGAGNIATGIHYPNLNSFDDVEFAGICDINEERLNETADEYGVEERFTNYQRMVEAVDPDAVFAIGPPELMYNVWVWCLEQGLNLYIEKPMGLTTHQAHILAHLAEENDCITQVSFQRRACPLLVKLREECLQYGPIEHAVCEFYKFSVEPFTLADGHMMNDGVHAVDTLRWMCGGEVVNIRPITRRIQVPDVNFIAALLEFDNDATGVLLNSWASGRRIFRVQMHAAGICGEGGPAGPGYLYAEGDTDGQKLDAAEVAGTDDARFYKGFGFKTRQFIDALKSGTLPESHFGDAVKTMEVADRILAQGLLQENSSD